MAPIVLLFELLIIVAGVTITLLVSVVFAIFMTVVFLVTGIVFAVNNVIIKARCRCGWHDYWLSTRDWRYHCSHCGKSKLYVTHA